MAMNLPGVVPISWTSAAPVRPCGSRTVRIRGRRNWGNWLANEIVSRLAREDDMRASCLF